MTYKRATLSMLVGLTLVPLEGAFAQERASTVAAVVAAAEYALREHGYFAGTIRPNEVLVDMEYEFWSQDESRLREFGQAAAAKLAAKLGARLGSVETVVQCPQRAPTVEELASGYWGCRMAAGTKMVVQINEPTAEGDTLFVWVGIWDEVTDREGNPRFVAGRGREVKLLRDDKGNWVAVGTRKGSAIG